MPGPAVGCLAGGAKKRISGRKLPLRIQELTKRSVKQLSDFNPVLDGFSQILSCFLFFFLRIRDTDGLCGIQCRSVWDFSFPI